MYQDDSLTLHTDLYQINMMQVYFDKGIHNKNAVFEVYFRKEPFENGYAVFAGLQRMVEYLKDLRFTETDYTYTYHDWISPSGGHFRNYFKKINETAISDVTILRLKFETDGVVYNLGVVDNKANGTGISDSYTDWTVEVSDTFKEIMKAVGYVLLIVLVIVLLSLLGVLAPIFKFIWNCILKLLKVVWWVLSSPIYLFKNKK